MAKKSEKIETRDHDETTGEVLPNTAVALASPGATAGASVTIGGRTFRRAVQMILPTLKNDIGSTVTFEVLSEPREQPGKVDKDGKETGGATVMRVRLLEANDGQAENRDYSYVVRVGFKRLLQENEVNVGRVYSITSIRKVSHDGGKKQRLEQEIVELME